MSKLSVHSTAPDTQIIDHHALDSKQAAIKGQIARHQYQSLAGILLDCPSSWVQKLKHRSIPTPFWYKAALFVTLTLLIALIVELLLGNPTRVTTIGVARLWVELASLLAASIIIIVAVKIHNMFLTALNECVIDIIMYADDLVHFNQWLVRTFDLRRQLTATFSLGLLLAVVAGLISININTGIDFALIIVLVVYGIQVASIVPATSTFFSMLQQLYRYRLQIYPIDPSNSKVIAYLSDSMSNIILVIGAVAAISTFFSFAFGLLNLTLEIITIY